MRRLFAAAVVLAILATLGRMPAQANEAKPNQTKPNILLIMSDDQSTTDPMSVMPQTRAFFSGGGTKFSNAYATTPLCCPSRASTYSGLYAHNHGITKNDGSGFGQNQTWQRLLHDDGYRTGIAGKFLNGLEADEAKHFDDRLPIESYGDPNDSRRIAGFASDFIANAEGKDAQPWALVLAPHAPHWPLNEQPLVPRPMPSFTPPRPEADLSDKHPAVAAAASLYARQGLPDLNPGLWEPRLGELQALDESVGVVVDRLREHKEASNTFAIYLSDNGFLWGEHGLFHKIWPYSESTRIPMFMRWPGRIENGNVDRRLVANIDVGPTILRAAGVDPDYPVDGMSLFPRAQRRESLLTELPDGFSNVSTGEIPPWSALIEKQRLRIEWADGFVESYDLERDPFLDDARSPGGARAAARLARLRACSGADCRH